MANFNVNVGRNRAELGREAAGRIAAELRRLAAGRDEISVLFASAPSQNETLAALAEEPDIPWDRMVAFHLDEYLGLSDGHPASFRRYLVDHLFGTRPVRRFTGIAGECARPEAEIVRYTDLLRAQPPALALLGIGENGHLAFNDPGVCDFTDPVAMKVVRLDAACREQQVHDGLFPSVAEVPTHAFTLTIPELMRVPKLFVMVPGQAKRMAVRDAVEGPVTEACPASILRRHPSAQLFLDSDSASLLRG